MSDWAPGYGTYLCISCGSEFQALEANRRRGWAVACSRSCAARARKFYKNPHEIRRGLSAVNPIDGEEWRPILGTAGYAVSSLGRVRRNDRLIKPYPDHGGYVMVGIILTDGTRQHRLVHKLVCEAFIGPCPDGMECCHDNGRRDDNRLTNLRYDTRLANMRDQYRHGTRVCGERSPWAKLSLKQVEEIRVRRKSGEGMRALGREFGVSHRTIGAIVTGKSWSNQHPVPETV